VFPLSGSFPDNPFPLGTTWDVKLAKKNDAASVAVWVPAGFSSTHIVGSNEWLAALILSDIPMKIEMTTKNNGVRRYEIEMYVDNIDDDEHLSDFSIGGIDDSSNVLVGERLQFVETQSVTSSFIMRYPFIPWFSVTERSVRLGVTEEDIVAQRLETRGPIYSGYKLRAHYESDHVFPDTFKVRVGTAAQARTPFVYIQGDKSEWRWGKTVRLELSNGYTYRQNVSELFNAYGTQCITYSFNTTTTDRRIRATVSNGVLTIERTPGVTSFPRGERVNVFVTARNSAGTSTAVTRFGVFSYDPDSTPIIHPFNPPVPVSLTAFNEYTYTQVLQPLFDIFGGIPDTYEYEVTTTNPLINDNISNGVLTIRPATPTTTWTGTESIVVTATVSNDAGSDTATITFNVANSRPVAPTIAARNAVVPVTLPMTISSGAAAYYSYTATRVLRPLFRTTGSDIRYRYEVTTTNPLINDNISNGVLTIEPATPTTAWTGTRDVVVSATASNDGGSDTATITFRVRNNRLPAPTIAAINAVVPVSLGTLVSSSSGVYYSYTATRVLRPLFRTTGSDIRYRYEVAANPSFIDAEERNGVLTIRPATTTITWTGAQYVIVTATAMNSTGSDTATIIFRVTNNRPVVAPTIAARNAVIPVTLGTLVSSRVGVNYNYIHVRTLKPLFQQTAGTTPVRYSYEYATNPSFIDAEERNGILTIRPATTTTAWTGAQYVIVTATAMNSAGSGTATIIFRVTNNRPVVAPTITARNAVENVTLQASNNYTETYDLPELFDTTGTDPKTYNYEIANTNTGLIIATKSNGELTIEPATTTIRWSGIRTLTVTATARNEAGTSSPASITFNVTNNRPAPNPPPGYLYCIPGRYIWEPPSCGWIQ